MSDAWRLAGRNAIAIAAVAFIAAIFRLPQPFLAVLAAFLLVGGNVLPHGKIPLRLAFAWVGALSGVLVAAAIPDQPWLLLPAFALMISGVLHFASLRRDPSVLIVAAVGAAAGVPSGIVDPHDALSAAFFHGINVTCGILSAALAFYLIPGKPASPQSPAPAYPFRRGLAVGIAAALSMVGAALFFPVDAVIMVVAGTVMATGLLTPGAAPMIRQRALGLACGFVISVAFDVIVAGSGNAISIFLLGLGGIFGALAWLGARRPGLHACTAQAASLCAIAAPMIPRPDVSLHAMGDRCMEVIAGCIIGAAVFQIQVWAERLELENNRCVNDVP